MQVLLKKPEIEKFIDDQVRAGYFPSPDAAIEQMMFDRDALELDEDTIAAINRAEAQIDRGEGIDFKTFATQMRDKFATND